MNLALNDIQLVNEITNEIFELWVNSYRADLVVTRHFEETREYAAKIRWDEVLEFWRNCF